LGEWSAELALQVVDVCISTRERNGGTIEMGELISRVDKMRGGGGSSGSGSSGSSGSSITPDDIARALDLLRPLKAGYSIHTAGGTSFVRSVPRALDTDQNMLLILASDSGGRLAADDVRAHTGWSALRARTALDDCVMREGLAWVDDVDASVWVVAAVEFDE
jgi:ESCRT-II complex subunit VPS22